MTCGVCHPEAFREGQGRVFGYAVADRPSRVAAGIRRLHYLGAEHVFTDEPKGRVKDRPGLKILRKVLCRGDRVILADEKSLGTKPAYVEANIETFEARGINVAIMRKEYFGN